SKAFKCLMETHKIETAGEAEDIAQRLMEMTYKGQHNCTCEDCQSNRLQKEYENPHGCTIAAKQVLDQLTEKWDPRHPDQYDGLDL
ncbi:hypothetical protein EDD85DRAFT_754790, partial [Armillaria nabsnona]